MNGPVRLAHQPRGSLEVELLHRARAERPTAGDLARLASGLGLGTTAVTCASVATAGNSALGSAAASSPLGTAAAANFTGLGATTGAAATGSVDGAATGVAASTVKPLVGVLSGTALRWLVLGGVCVVLGAGAMAGVKRLRQQGPSVAAPGSGAEARVEAVSPVTGSSSGTEGVPAGNATLRSANASGLASLAPEISMLDRARALIDSSQPNAALALLDSYDSQFPAGTLAPEARVIRVQALLRGGKRAQAVKLGAEFLSSAPTSPHAHKIRDLLTPEGAGQRRPTR